MNPLSATLAPTKTKIETGNPAPAMPLPLPSARTQIRRRLPVAVHRYSFAIALACIACLIRLPTQHLGLGDLALLAPFAAVATVATVAGWFPGLTTTAVIATGDLVLRHVQPPLFATDPEMRLLVEGCLLFALVGSAVFAASRRAKESSTERLDLERKVLEISDDERRRIGHDLHDGLGQHLTGISLLSASLAQRMENGAAPNGADARQISQLVAETIGWTRDLARGLSPLTLESDGLRAALEEIAQNARSILRIECSCRCEGPEPQIDRQAALHIFRIVQEAVNNSVKHGKARNVRISLDVREQTLTARVIDDGCGLSAKTKANPGLGLRIMQYRARMVGATLSVSRAGHAGGTVITCRCTFPNLIAGTIPDGNAGPSPTSSN